MKSVILEFITASTTDQPVLKERVTAIYKKLFEQAATDINKKQIAADPGTCSQGIVQNEILSNDKSVPNGIVGDLMNTSYASRFGQEKSVAEPGRSSTGIGGSLNNENVNASVCNEAVETLASGINVREGTKEEFDKVWRTLLNHEMESYYNTTPKDELEKIIQSGLDWGEYIWKRHNHAYTLDGNQMVVTALNNDGSTYICFAYLEPSRRGSGMASTLLRKIIDESPNGVSIHTDKGNSLVRGMLKHYGFTEYPSRHPTEIFMTNKPGIGGEEWWGDTIPQDDTPIITESAEQAAGFNVREATYDEFIKSFAECSLNETGFYFDDDSNRVTLLYLCMKEAIPVWKRKTHAYTIDGLDLVCTVPTKDGTPYIYAVYTAPEHRGKGYTGALMRKAIADAPNGISLHTHINNNKAKSVYEHYGFKVYPTTCKHEWFMATKPGIGGREIWDDTTDYSGETEADAITG